MNAEPAGAAADLVARMELQRRLDEAVLALDEPYRSAALWPRVGACRPSVGKSLGTRIPGA